MTDRRSPFLENTDAVSEVIGEVLMTAVAVLAFSVVAVFIFSYAAPQEKVHADIQGWVGVDSDTIYLRHAGGESIDISEVRVLLDINETRRELTPSELTITKGSSSWILGETININTSQLWSYNIDQDDYVAVTLISTGSNLVIKNGILLGTPQYAVSSPNGSTLTAPILSNKDPVSTYQSNISQKVTFSASSSQSSVNEFLLDGQHIEWSNGTSPSYTNTSASEGTYNLTLIARNAEDSLLIDSIEWDWTVISDGGMKLSGFGTDMYLLKAENGGYIPAGDYIQFKTGTGGNSITFDGVTTSIGNNKLVKLVMNGHQTSGTAHMGYSGSSRQISMYDFNIDLYLDGNLVKTGQVSNIDISKAENLESTLSYSLPSYLSQTYFTEDGNSTVLIDSDTPDSSEIRLYNVTPTDTVSFELDFDSSSTVIDGFDAQYEVIA